MFNKLKLILVSNKSDRRAYLAYVVLFLLYIIINTAIKFFVKPPETDFTAIKAEYLAYLDRSKHGQVLTSSEGITEQTPTDSQVGIEMSLVSSAEDKSSTQKQTTSQKSKSEKFNPNKITEKQLANLGLNQEAITNFIKYRATGAKFYKLSEIEKVYGFTATDLALFKPHITFSKKPKAKTKSEQPIPIINLNTATKEDLMKLPSIGEKKAEKIIAYRKQIGKFTSVAQIKEVKGISEKGLGKFEQYLRLK